MDNLLFNNISSRSNISAVEFELIEKVLVKRFYKRKKTLLNEGELSRYIYFVNKGCIRSYSMDKEGNEHVVQLAIEDYWIADLFSFTTQKPGALNIEAIEDSEVWMLPHAELDSLCGQIPGLEKYFRLLYQRAYVSLQQRLDHTLSISAEERYRDLIEQQPHIATRVPLIYIASYLGITPESLSRIRKQMYSTK